VTFGLYGLALVLAVLAALPLLGLTAPKAGVSPKKAFDLGFWLIVAGLAGSRAAYVLFHPKSFAHSPLSALKYWEGGLMFQGGLIAGLALAITLAAMGRFRFLPMADAIAPALALGQAIGRVGCLLAGCCYGRLAPGGFPLALTFPRGALAPAGIPLYPTQAAESIGLFLLTYILIRLLGRPRPAGLVLAAYLALAGLIRFSVDLFRGDFRGPKTLGLAPTSWVALAAMLSGLALGLWLLARKRPVTRK
jgi:phosphatidylglycerol:prolipoprotein diacylglycerol transferase